MNNSEDSWDSASIESLVLEKKEIITRENNQTTKLKILHKLLFAIEMLKKPRYFQISDELNDHEILKQLKNKKGKLSKELTNGFFIDFNRNFENFYTLDEFCPISEQGEWIKKITNDIELFIDLNKNGVKSQLYFVIDKQTTTFLEPILNRKLVENNNKFNGFIFSINENGQISDQTHVFSKKCTHFRIYYRILGSIITSIKYYKTIGIQQNNNMKMNDSFADNKTFINSIKPNDLSIEESNNKIRNNIVSVFDNINETRLLKIPSSINKIKTHSLYITESILRPEEFIHPKRPVCGFLNGEPVYLRNNIKKLKSVKGWYRLGRILKIDSNKLETSNFEERGAEILKSICEQEIEPKETSDSIDKKDKIDHSQKSGKGLNDKISQSDYFQEKNEYLLRENIVKPYRIVKGKKMYSEYQTEPIIITTIKCKTMDAFCNHFVPVDCYYYNYDSNICKELGIKYSDCVVGFKNKEMIIKGFFAYKKDSELIEKAIIQKNYFKQLKEYNEEWEKTLEAWRDFAKKISQYLKIKKRIGL